MAEVDRIEDRKEVLRRQVVSSWTKDDGSPMSVAFHPTPKDLQHLSTDRERITVQESFSRYVAREGVTPAATWPVPVGVVLDANQCLDEPPRSSAALHILDDGNTGALPDGHASVVFAESYPGVESKSGFRKVNERLAAEIKKEAIRRGPLYSAADAATAAAESARDDDANGSVGV